MTLSPEQIAALPPDGGLEFNRLIHETSPYLLQHARNPVDWYPWGDEAFAKAGKEGKPIFLSVGYSTCHWCHVMERESFERDDVAAILNAHFVAIKVDREERPDLDEIYMTATQLFTGRGGWPNSVWLTPDGRPWFAGTYFPREDFGGRPGLKSVLTQLGELWAARRDVVEAQADRIADAMKQVASARQVEPTGELGRALVERAVAELRAQFDDEHGGFGGAPKFPPHAALDLLLLVHRLTGDESALHMATRTLDAMARGGIHDHVGGGFHRYATDARWLVPHFEKMLSDNAQLARAYVDGWRAKRNDEYRDVAIGIYDWVLREMTSSEGAFYSAYDADSEGVEGKFYVWRRDETLDVLGNRDGELFCRVYGVEPRGNFADEATGRRTGPNILHLPKSLDEAARDEGVALDELTRRMRAARARLLEARVKRVWPHLDDKVLTSWNGLMIGALAHGGRHLDEPRYVEAAERAAAFILTTMRKDGRLLCTYRSGEAKLNAYLDDYAFLADGLLDLYEATGKARYLDEARALVDALIRHYHDASGGGFCFTSDDHEELLLRSKDAYDRALPSGNGVAARVLVRLGTTTGEQRYLDLARSTLETFLGAMERAPTATQTLIAAAALFVEAEQSGEKAGAAARARKGPVTVEAFLPDGPIVPGGKTELAVRLTVDGGWHVNSHVPSSKDLVATTVTVDGPEGVNVGDVAYPDGRSATLGFSESPLSVYDGVVQVSVPLTVEATVRGARLTLTVEYQACSDSACLAPERVTLSVSLPVDAAGVSEQ